MHALILHQRGTRIHHIERGLKYENISAESRLCDLHLDDAIIQSTDVIVLYAVPHSLVRNAVLQLRREKSFLTFFIIEKTFSEATRALSASLGVDAYVAEPFEFSDLAAQAKEIIARKMMLRSQHRWMRAFDICLDLHQHFAKRKNQHVRLRNKEFALLEFFMHNRGRVLTRNMILDHVWDRNANFASNTVDVHINRLRRKIDVPFKQKLIHTIPCVGYIFDKRRLN